MKYAFIDFEYNQSKNRSLNLVCSSLGYSDREETHNHWLHKVDARGLIDRGLLKDHLLRLNEQGYVFLAYNVVAEARSFLALGLNPLDFKWIDLYLEYRCLTNHNHNYMYGKQLKKGRKVYTKCPPPKWERSEEDDNKADGSKPEHNLGSAIYKVLGVVIDTAFKDATRDLIISDPERFTEEEQETIMTYCESDIRYLLPLLKGMAKEYRRLLGKHYNFKQLLGEMYARSEYAVRTSAMEEIGYPINYDRTRNFSQQVPAILYKCQTEINREFPETFKRKPDYSYSWTQANARGKIKEWLKANPRTRWKLTNGGKSGKKDLSLSLKAFSQHFSFSHNYPRDNYFAQIIRYLKLKQNLNGFLVGGKGKKFWDYYGDDGRVRPYMNIYGAQSARSQPSASGFIPLKSAWMRTLIEPKKGKVIAGIDWASQEFMIGALLSGDESMLKAYESGDVYLAFAKDSKLVPKDATKESHKKERDSCKPIILGLQFDMTKYGLAKDLTEKWGRKVSTDEAQIWVNRHHRAYAKFWRYKKKVETDYTIHRFLKLPCGWYMWGDNPNKRSVGNVPIQGMASSIMRKAVQLAQERGLDVIYTLHDAIYIEYNISDVKHESVVILAECMDRAFRYYFPKKLQGRAMCRLDADIWSPSFPETTKYFDLHYSAGLLPVKQQQEYVDERGEKELESFRKYFKAVDYTEDF